MDISKVCGNGLEAQLFDEWTHQPTGVTYIHLTLEPLYKTRQLQRAV